MTYDLKALRDLEKRLAEAKGGHDDDAIIERREINAWIHDNLMPEPKVVVPLGYTTSLDAAVALVERVLWGRGLLIGRGRTRPSEPLWGAQILASDENEECREMPILAEAESDTAALALCLACVRALIAQAEAA